MLTYIWLAIIIIPAVAVILHILLTMRDESERASLWIILVIGFPLIGVIFYLLAGLTRRNTLGSKVEHMVDEFMAGRANAALRVLSDYNQAITPFVSPEKEEGGKTLSYKVTIDRVLPDSTPVAGNRVELLCGGTMAYPLMIESIRAAKQNIHMQSFILADDRVGSMILEELVKKASAGVNVKIIYDGFGSLKTLFSHTIKKYNKKVPNFRMLPFSNASLFSPWKIQLRNHRKLLVIDGETAFVGGLNISDDNFRLFSRRKREIHDLHCMIRGPAVGELQFSFLSDWCYASKCSPEQVFLKEYFPLPASRGDNIVRVVASGHGYTFEGSEKLFFTAVTTAKNYVWLMTPYFVPDKSFVKTLRMAALRGVDVRIIVPKNNNHWFMKMASRSLYESLVSDGVRVMEKDGEFSHAKAMLVDGEWAMVGSSNCDIRSFRLNYELDIVVSGGKFIHNLHSQFLSEFSESDEVSLDFLSQKKVTTRLAESLCALMTPVL